MLINTGATVQRVKSYHHIVLVTNVRRSGLYYVVIAFSAQYYHTTCRIGHNKAPEYTHANTHSFFSKLTLQHFSGHY